MEVPPTRRIVLLGKSGSGKSSLANTIFGETLFQMSHLPTSQTSTCQSEKKIVNGRRITLIDTPGFFDTDRSEESIKPEILGCIVECSPGPHAFIIVLKVEKFTDHEKEVISKTCQYFTEEALRYAAVVFTHGDQLPEKMTIQEFVSQSEGLMDLMKKCGARCHVFDNKYWNGEAQIEHRSNRFQVDELLNIVDKIVMENQGGHYTNDFLQEVEAEIQEEEKRIRQPSGDGCQEESRKKAKMAVYTKTMAKFAKLTGKGLMIAALIGGFEGVGLVALGVKGVNTIRKAASKKKPETVKGKDDSAGKVEAKPKDATAPTKEKTAPGFFSNLLKMFKRTNENAGDEVNAGENGEVTTMEEDGMTDEGLMTTEEDMMSAVEGGTLEVVGAEEAALHEEVDGELVAAAEEIAEEEEASAAVEEVAAAGGQVLEVAAVVIETAAQNCCIQ